MKKLRKSVLAFTIAGLVGSGPVAADISYARAEVVDVQPLFETYQVSVPQEVCLEQEVAYQSPRPRSATAPILGAVIGGAIGNAVGHKKENKRVGAVAGVLLGGAIGADIGRRNAYKRDRVSYRTEQVCHTEREVREEERQVGYRVSYFYGGQTYTTRMDQEPGKRIPVTVSVTPTY